MLIGRPRKNYYFTLGLPADATPQAIAARCDLLESLCNPQNPRYRRATLPDDLMQEVREARAILLDRYAREKYDTEVFATLPPEERDGDTRYFTDDELLDHHCGELHFLERNARTPLTYFVIVMAALALAFGAMYFGMRYLTTHIY